MRAGSVSYALASNVRYSNRQRVHAKLVVDYSSRSVQDRTRKFYQTDLCTNSFNSDCGTGLRTNKAALESSPLCLLM